MSRVRTGRNFDDSAISEKIVALKRSKAGYLGVLTKIYRQLDEYLKEYKYSSEVRYNQQYLTAQWCQFTRVYQQLCQSLTDENEQLFENNRYAIATKDYELYMSLIDNYLAAAEDYSLEREVDHAFDEDNSVRDTRSIISSRSKASRDSRRSSSSKCEAKLSKIIAEKKLEQLKRSKERKLKEQSLKLENEIAEAEDEAELARTKDEFYEDEMEIDGLNNVLYASENGSVNTAVLHHVNQPTIMSDVVATTSSFSSNQLHHVNQPTIVSDVVPTSSFSSNQLHHVNQPTIVYDVVPTSSFSSNQLHHVNQPAVVSDVVVTTSPWSSNGLCYSNQRDVTYVVNSATLQHPPNQFHHSSQHGFVAVSNINTASCLAAQVHQSPLPMYTSTPAQPQMGMTEPAEVSNEVSNNATATMMEKITLGMDSILTRSTLPPLAVVKFSGEPHAYHRFKARFHEMVESQNISELQKMSRLLQFLEGDAKNSVAGYEGVPGGLKIALKVLEQRFGQPHMVAKSCVDALIDGPNISINDTHALREFADKSRSLYETLKSMNALSEMNMTNLAKMSSKLPIPLQAKWRDKAQQIRVKGQPPSVKELVEFIERQADAANDPVFGRIGESQRSYPKPPFKLPVRKGPPTHAPLSGGSRVTTLATQVEAKSHDQHTTPSSKYNATSESYVKCYICGLSHTIEKCSEFADKSVRQRSVLVRQKGLCINCLRKGHFAAQCNSKFRCKECKQAHHTLLHKSYEDKINNETVNNAPKAEQTNTHVTTVADKSELQSTNYANTSMKKGIALQVVPVQIQGNDSNTISTYALLDTGSEDTFVSRNIVDKLGLCIEDYDDLSVRTLSGESKVKVGRVDLEIKAVHGEQDSTVKIKDVKVIKDLSINTTKPKDLSKWSHLKDIVIPQVDESEVTMLIGVNVPQAHTHIEHRAGKAGEPYAVKTVLGWAVLGPVDSVSTYHSSVVNVNYVKYGSELTDQQMSQFLRLEDAEMNIKEDTQALSISDQECLKKMQETTRIVDGHYEVGMLWKSDQPWLPDNRILAETRLQPLKRKLKRDEDLHGKYRDFMNNLLTKGYARRLTVAEASVRTNKTWYLPHHGVFHPQKRDKIRVVFDAAAQHDGVSLNNQLHQGPDMTNSLLGILLRFRQNTVALVADIEGMFNQVKVPPADADALRFLWWDDKELETVSEFRMTSHIFGATDSPSCANFCLKKVAQDNKGTASKAAVDAIENDFYVDDFVKSVSTEEEATSLVSEVTGLLSKSGFRLTKWMSNHREVLSTVPEEERSKPLIDLDLDKLPVQRTLGVQWDVEEDVFLFKVNEPSKPSTKRGILSAISSLYDPIGFISPVLLEAKKVVQSLWKLNIGWDDPIPDNLRDDWHKWKQELVNLSTVKIPRVYIANKTDIVHVSLHMFADASEDGYGMCAYLRFVQACGLISCCFVIGRSRSAPVRPISIPRLELQAATLSVRIYRMLRNELTLNIDRTVFWTDSQTVLQYIRNNIKRFHVYVANRVAEIRDVTDPDQWRHCPGRLNPADDASRGLKPQKLSQQHRWWRGPEFLWQTEDTWPVTTVDSIPDDDLEVRKDVNIHQVSVTTTTDTACAESSSVPDANGKMKELIYRCSSWSRLQRQVAWILRFCKWIASKRSTCDKGILTLEELNRSTCIIAHVVQEECFHEELSELKKKGEVRRTSPIADLRPTVVDGIIRVGGRLQEATDMTLDERHPIILPKRHHVCELIARHYHVFTAHCGREQTLYELRRLFWIVGGRSLVKDTIRKCIICRRMNAKPMQQVMAPLPKVRVQAYYPPFTFTGVDLFGPMFVKWGRGTVKRWGCLFTCLNTRAIYLEVVPSLSTDDFIMVLRQFIGRRGSPKEIWSDRGTNFVGANSELKQAIAQWNNDAIQTQLQQKGIKWVFQPPASPHMSGVWERLVKMTKKHIKAVIGDKLLNDFELRTLFTEIEAVVNNRPITAVSDDPTDLTALTPNHFLLQRTAQLPPGTFVKEDQFSRKRWRKIQLLVNLYWRRWLREYLPNLQRRSKWLTSKRNIQVGDLVLIVDNNSARNKWQMARVQEVFTGRDERVRSATVKTSNGSLHRPIAKLCLLENHKEE